jgi:N-acetyl sugar amidotransferase
MDTSDPEIIFDNEGVCNYCNEFKFRVEEDKNYNSSEILSNFLSVIKESGKGKEYDCIIGLSGGVDSSYQIYKAKDFGLRPLAVHVDTGWNSELAVMNIENIVKKLNVDLFTYVVNWEEMRDLQLSFFKASVPNCDIPQDHVYSAVLFKIAAEKNIKWILTGSNSATEFILPKAWGYSNADLKHLKHIHKSFGKVKLKTYPTKSIFKASVYYPYIKRIKICKLLNYMNYNKAEAKKILIEELNWRDYGGKHYESIFTKFFQAHYLPYKFGFDKRRAHASSLIVSGQITRDEALEEMKLPLYDLTQLNSDKEYMAKKLGIDINEFNAILNSKPKYHEDYPNNKKLYNLILIIKKLLKL